MSYCGLSFKLIPSQRIVRPLAAPLSIFQSFDPMLVAIQSPLDANDDGMNLAYRFVVRSDGRSNKINFTLKTVELTLKTVELTLKAVELTLKAVELTLKAVEARVHLSKAVDNYGPQLGNPVRVSAHFAHERTPVFATALAFSPSERRMQT